MRLAFPALLRRLLNERGLTIRGFAKQIGASHGYVGDIVSWKRRPPEQAREWGAVLGLEGQDLDGFVLAAGLSRADRVVVDHVDRLEAEAEKRVMGKGKRGTKG